MDEKRNRQKRSVFLIVLIFMLLISVSGYLLFQVFQRRNEPESRKDSAPNPDHSAQGLVTPEDFLPGNLSVGSYLDTGMLEDAEGQIIDSISRYVPEGNNIWLLYWASWCPDCEQQLEDAEQMLQLAERYHTTLLLVDRLEKERETRKLALDTLAQRDLSLTSLFDPERTLYDRIKAKELPTHIILSHDGQVLAYDHGVLPTSVCEGLLKKAAEGPQEALLRFLQEKMTYEDGGLVSEIEYSKDRPDVDLLSEASILSESQGLLMQAALFLDKKALFQKQSDYVRDNMMREGLPCWNVSTNGKKADTDALLDDLRILWALSEGGRKWGEPYQLQASQLADAIAYGLTDEKGRLVDYCDLKNGKKAHTLSLSYIDIIKLLRLKEHLEEINTTRAEQFEKSIEQAEEILKSGYISEEFPLYYAAYDYSKKRYLKADLNTSEALYTLLHLSECGQLKPESMEWLRARVYQGNLYAGYNVNGNVAEGHAYHSTAVYGLAALIALSEGDEQLLEYAVRRMERLLIKDYDSSYYGAFVAESSPIYAFDQCIPLLVYAAHRDHSD